MMVKESVVENSCRLSFSKIVIVKLGWLAVVAESHLELMVVVVMVFVVKWPLCLILVELVVNRFHSQVVACRRREDPLVSCRPS